MAISTIVSVTGLNVSMLVTTEPVVPSSINMGVAHLDLCAPEYGQAACWQSDIAHYRCTPQQLTNEEGGNYFAKVLACNLAIGMQVVHVEDH